MCVVLVALLAATWVLSAVVVADNRPEAVAAGRSLFSLLGLILVAGRSPSALKRSMKSLVARPAALLLAGVLGVAIYSLFSLWAIAGVGVSVTNLIVATAPALTLTFGALFFRERYPRTAVLAVVVAVMGAVIYTLSSVQAENRPFIVSVGGVAAAIVAVCSAAFYGHYYARLAEGQRSGDLLLGVFLFGTVVLLAVMCLTGSIGGLAELRPLDWLWLFVLGVVVYVPVYILQHRLIHERGAVFTATLSLAVPAVVRAADVVLFGRPFPAGLEALGLLVSLCGMVFVLRIGILAGRERARRGAREVGREGSPPEPGCG